MLRIIVSAALFLVITNGFAQPVFHAKIGLNLATMSLYPKYKDRNQILHGGIHAGVQLQYPLSENWGVGTELAVDQKGAERLMSVRSGAGYALTLTNIEVPVLITRRICGGLSVSGGVSTAYVVKAGFRSYSNYKENVSQYYKKIDLSSRFGITYEVGSYAFGATFSYGLMKTNEVPGKSDGERMFTNEILPFGRNKVFGLSLSHQL